MTNLNSTTLLRRYAHSYTFQYSFHQLLNGPLPTPPLREDTHSRGLLTLTWHRSRANFSARTIFRTAFKRRYHFCNIDLCDVRNGRLHR